MDIALTPEEILNIYSNVSQMICFAAAIISLVSCWIPHVCKAPGYSLKILGAAVTCAVYAILTGIISPTLASNLSVANIVMLVVALLALVLSATTFFIPTIMAWREKLPIAIWITLINLIALIPIVNFIVALVWVSRAIAKKRRDGIPASSEL